MPSLAGRMMKGSAWITGARAAINAIGFISTIVLARLLVPADFGLVALGTTILAIITAVTDMSLSQALVQHRAPSDDHFHTAWTLNAIRGLLLAGIMCLAGRPLALLYGEPRLEMLIYALAFSVLISGFSNPRTVILSKQLIFWQDFLLSVSERLVSVVVAISIALYFRTYWALVAGAVAGQAAMLILSYLILPFRPRVVFRHARELWSFSIWLTLGQAMNTINWRFDQLLIGQFLGRTTLGYYAVGDNLAQMPTREAITPLTHTLFPALSRIADEPHRLRAGYQRAQSIVTAVALPVGVGFALLAHPLVLAAMGAKWLPAVPIIQALSAVFALQTLGSLVQPLGMAKGETKLLFRRDLQMFLIRLPTIISAMMLWGLPGLIYARVFTGLFAAFVNMGVVRRLTGLAVRTQLKANWRSLSSVGAMVAGVMLIQRWFVSDRTDLPFLLMELAIIAISGAVIYIGCSTLLWIAARRPPGPETEVAQILARLLNRLSKSPAAHDRDQTR